MFWKLPSGIIPIIVLIPLSSIEATCTSVLGNGRFWVSAYQDPSGANLWEATGNTFSAPLSTCLGVSLGAFSGTVPSGERGTLEVGFGLTFEKDLVSVELPALCQLEASHNYFYCPKGEWIQFGDWCYRIDKCGKTYADAQTFCAQTTYAGKTGRLAADLDCSDLLKIQPLLSAWNTQSPNIFKGEYCRSSFYESKLYPTQLDTTSGDYSTKMCGSGWPSTCSGFSTCTCTVCTDPCDGMGGESRYTTGLCYKYFTSDKTWINAMCDCANTAPSGYFGRLVRIEDNEIMDFYHDELNCSPNCTMRAWTGGRSVLPATSLSSYPSQYRWMDTLAQADPNVPILPPSGSKSFGTADDDQCVYYYYKEYRTGGTTYTKRFQNGACFASYDYICEYIKGSGPHACTWSTDTLTLATNKTLETCDSLVNSGKKAWFSPESNTCFEHFTNNEEWNDAMTKCKNYGAAKGLKGRLGHITTERQYDLYLAHGSTSETWGGLRAFDERSRDINDWVWMNEGPTVGSKVEFLASGIYIDWNEGKGCMTFKNYQEYEQEDCDDDHDYLCEYYEPCSGVWGAWGPCSETCGTGVRTRSFLESVSGPDCPPDESEICLSQICPGATCIPNSPASSIATLCSSISNSWYSSESDTCFHKLSNQRETADAMDDCIARGLSLGVLGRLAHIISSTQFYEAYDLSNGDKVWIGIQTYKESNLNLLNNFYFMESRGKPAGLVTYMPPGGVNYNSERHCVYLEDDRYRQEDCSKTEDYICEYYKACQGVWAEWSSCSPECGAGCRSRTFIVTVAGPDCPTAPDMEDCFETCAETTTAATTTEPITSTTTDVGTTKAVTTPVPILATTIADRTSTTTHASTTTQTTTSTEQVTTTTQKETTTTKKDTTTTEADTTTTEADAKTTEESMTTIKLYAATTVQDITITEEHAKSTAKGFTTAADEHTTPKADAATTEEVTMKRLTEQFTTIKEDTTTTTEDTTTTKEDAKTTKEDTTTTKEDTTTTKADKTTTKEDTTTTKEDTTTTKVDTTTTKEDTTTTKEDTTTSEQDTTTTKEDTTTTKEDTTTSEQDTTTTKEDTTTTKEDTTTSEQDTTTTKEDTTTTKEDTTTSEQDTTTTKEDTTTSEQDTTTTKEDTTTTKEDTTTSEQDTTTTKEDTTTTKEDTTTTKEDTTTSEQDTTTTKEDTTTSEQDTTTTKEDTTTSEQDTTTTKEDTTTSEQDTTTEKASTATTVEFTTAMDVVTTTSQKQTTTLKKTTVDDVATTEYVTTTTQKPALTSVVQKVTTSTDKPTTTIITAAAIKTTSAGEVTTTTEQNRATTTEVTSSSKKVTTTIMTTTTAAESTTHETTRDENIVTTKEATTSTEKATTTYEPLTTTVKDTTAAEKVTTTEEDDTTTTKKQTLKLTTLTPDATSTNEKVTTTTKAIITTAEVPIATSVKDTTTAEYIVTTLEEVETTTELPTTIYFGDITSKEGTSTTKAKSTSTMIEVSTTAENVKTTVGKATMSKKQTSSTVENKQTTSALTTAEIPTTKTTTTDEKTTTKVIVTFEEQKATHVKDTTTMETVVATPEVVTTTEETASTTKKITTTTKGDATTSCSAESTTAEISARATTNDGSTVGKYTPEKSTTMVVYSAKQERTTAELPETSTRAAGNIISSSTVKETTVKYGTTIFTTPMLQTTTIASLTTAPVTTIITSEAMKKFTDTSMRTMKSTTKRTAATTKPTKHTTTIKSQLTPTMKAAELEAKKPECKFIWGEWSKCGRKCGKKFTRKRYLVSEVKGCKDSAEEEEKCPFKPCSSDCTWREWGEWGLCSVSCGNGTMKMYRGIESKAVEKGKPCSGPNMKTKPCTADCIVPTIPPAIEGTLDEAGVDESTLEDSAAVSSSIQDSLPFLLDSITDEVKKGMGHSLLETIPICTFAGEKCKFKKEFKSIYDPSLGNCFTYNFAFPSDLMTYRGGPEYGLKILLQGSQSDYMCTSQTAGFKVIIHNATEHPFPDTTGVLISPGTTNNIAIKQTTVNRLPPPIGDCIPQEDLQNYFYNGTFTVEGCMRSCFQTILIDNCKCGDPKVPLPPDTKAKKCTLQQKSCLDYFRECASDIMQSVDCECHNPCTETLFETAVTTAELKNLEMLKKTCHSSNEASKDIYECLGNTKKNFALLHIYYERLNSRVYTEKEAYTLYQLSSDFGGLMGTIVGPSAITIVEFGYCIVGLIYHLASNGKSIM